MEEYSPLPGHSPGRTRSRTRHRPPGYTQGSQTASPAVIMGDILELMKNIDKLVKCTCLNARPTARLGTQKAARLEDKLLGPKPEVSLILVRCQHLEVVRQGHVTVLAAQGTGQRVAVVRMKGELSVIELGPGIMGEYSSRKSLSLLNLD